MGYLNISMTKRASLAALLGTAGALGATAGGLAGHYGSDKPDNTPATILGALGGGAGSAAGIASVFPKLDGAAIDINNTALHLKRLADVNEQLRSAAVYDPALVQYKDELVKQIDAAPKWIKTLAKHPKLRKALMLGGLGLGAGAGGTLGAMLGVKGGDALA